jgi:N-acyl-D-amino-acid deacylase
MAPFPKDEGLTMDLMKDPKRWATSRMRVPICKCCAAAVKTRCCSRKYVRDEKKMTLEEACM